MQRWALRCETWPVISSPSNDVSWIIGHWSAGAASIEVLMLLTNRRSRCCFYGKFMGLKESL